METTPRSSQSAQLPPSPSVGQPPAYGYPPSQPPAAAPPPSPARPLLGPLAGASAWQGETRAVLKELVANLVAPYRVRVANVPLVFDPNPNEVNAFASCDDSGAPFIAGTEGLLDAVDGISQTKATDELYGTQTYDAYVNLVAPRLVSKDGGSSLIPAGLIASPYWLDSRRISRAHEMFDEIVAFTFGHELSHHYLGHTGCTGGQAGGLGPSLAQVEQQMAQVPWLRWMNQPNEVVADSNGCINTLDAGRARASQGYRWTEEGGICLLDFFARLDRASGANPFLGFLRTHPSPGLRIPVVQGVAATWRLQHSG